MRLRCLLIALSLLSIANAAGVAIHNTIVSRVHSLLPLEIQDSKYLPYIIAGSFFPDLFYSCSTWNNASEEAHWPPFLQVAVHLHNELRDDGRKEELLQFKAFLYGIFTHQATDSSWHSLGIRQGFMEMLAVMEFAGSFENAHSYLDTAGDFLHLMKVADVGYYLTQWELPDLGLIKEVFRRVGYPDISEGEIVQCVNVGRSAIVGEISVRDPTGRVMLQQSPLSGLLLEDYFIGGLREISGSIERCLGNLDDWFQGKMGDPWKLCGSIIKRDVTSISSVVSIKNKSQGEIVVISPYISLAQFGHALTIGDFLNEPSVAISSVEENGSVHVLPLSEYIDTITQNTKTIKIKPSSFPNEFSYNPQFGNSLKPVMLFNNKSFLIVTEPGLSLIHLYYQNERIFTIYNAQTSTRYGAGHHKQQFTVITTIPVSTNSRFEDIIVASPFDDVNHSPQSGVVRILSTSRIQALILAGVTRVEINQVTKRWFALSYQFRQKFGYEQFGAAISVDSRNVYISSRGLGVVFVYAIETYVLKQVIDQSKVSNIESASRARQTSQESRLFGESISTVEWNGVQYVLISACSYGNAATGAVFLYKVEQTEGVMFKSVITLGNALNWYINAQFGLDVTVDETRGMLYISAPSYKGHGAIFKVNMNEVVAGSQTKPKNMNGGSQFILKRSNDITVFSVEEKDIVVEGTGYNSQNGKGYTGLGKSIEYSNEILIYTEEYFGFDEFFNDEKRLTGRVGLLKQ